MIKKNVIAIFDIGKSNKKVFLFDENYKVVWEKSVELPETKDEDGDPCEDIDLLTKWILDTWFVLKSLQEFTIKAINFSTYGASFVYVDKEGNSLTPIYNYIKTYPKSLQDSIYTKYGGEETFALKTASPVLGSLNSGMQLYRLQQEQALVFEKMKYSLHFPQFVSSLFSKTFYSEITSIGCHTNLWDFQKNNYHTWVNEEGLIDKMPPIKKPSSVVATKEGLLVGTGLHDSSSALIPYLIKFKEPFVLLSTGTWCISLNPFNGNSLTSEELRKDCLCYLSYEGKPVKASRLFAGNEHAKQVKTIAEYFRVSFEEVENTSIDNSILDLLKLENPKAAFKSSQIEQCENYQSVYHQLMFSIVNQQIDSLNLVLNNSPVNGIFIDGGFSKNRIFTKLLNEAFPEIDFYVAELAQASALGAALVIHEHWNSKTIPDDLIALQKVS